MKAKEEENYMKGIEQREVLLPLWLATCVMVIPVIAGYFMTWSIVVQISYLSVLGAIVALGMIFSVRYLWCIFVTIPRETRRMNAEMDQYHQMYKEMYKRNPENKSRNRRRRRRKRK